MPSSALTVIREMQLADYAAVRALWEQTENIGLNESDTETAVVSFLARNAGLSAVATKVDDGRIIGALLCGHDGRRGYLHHLAVTRDQRGHGIGRKLVEFAEAGLRRAGILKVNLFVFGEHDNARSFWEHHGWLRPEWQVMQKRISGCSEGDRRTC